MVPYPIAHYKKSGSSVFVNGGTLTVTDADCIIEHMKKEVARFAIGEMKVTKAPAELLYEGIRLSDSKQSIDLYFLKGSRTAKEIRKSFFFNS